MMVRRSSKLRSLLLVKRVDFSFLIKSKIPPSSLHSTWSVTYSSSLSKMTAPRKPRVDLEYYEQPKVINYFDNIINDLRIDLDKEGADTSFSAPDLAYFTAHFQKFQLDHICHYSSKKVQQHQHSNTAAVPFIYFTVHDSMTSKSPLYTILKAAYKFKSDYQIVDWRFEANEEVTTYLKMVEVIKESLASNNFELSIPRIFLYNKEPATTNVKKDEEVDEEEEMEKENDDGRDNWISSIRQLGGRLNE
ncbi:hypothetical protein BDF20DRAFT_862726 [Mycotypha africana]|uniref:uncharacterized protein n=1 Tax=Mycotypha africana TaxID=64632 RepID=UPI00230075DB|nr:uncharacterized protein BDF20DRAFT_862726 [Mycotypha africana]KAI8981692.1 hypothetical protein BDF20DRAFT_862726 [Mycotypha africana]